MTKHNLNLHISWLLSHGVAPPASAIDIVPTDTNRNTAAQLVEETSNILEEAEEAEEAEEEISQTAPTSEGNQLPTATVNTFVRPPLPPSIAPKPQPRDTILNSEDAQMLKLGSSKKPSRPGLYSQQQLATPASTSSSTVAPKSTLSRSYGKLLREGSGGCPLVKC